MGVKLQGLAVWSILFFWLHFGISQCVHCILGPRERVTIHILDIPCNRESWTLLLRNFGWTGMDKVRWTMSPLMFYPILNCRLSKHGSFLPCSWESYRVNGCQRIKFNTD